MKTTSSCKTIHYILLLEPQAYIAMALNLERLYDKTSDFGFDYKTGR